MRFLLFLSLALLLQSAHAQQLHELSLDGWKELREVERYQLQIAEKYWQQQDWMTAANEYEKFVSLYESSSGAAYAQMRWSLAQVHLRKQNTAIKEGFQTVIDYWPDSEQAIASSYFIGRTQREIGQLQAAKASLKSVVTRYPKHVAAVQALGELIQIAHVENDTASKVELWKRLTHDIPRTQATTGLCVQASQQLATHWFGEAAFDEGVKALATTYPPEQMAGQVAQFVRGPLAALAGQAESKSKADQLLSSSVAWLKSQMPADVSTDEGKTLTRQCLLAVADLTGLAQHDDEVPDAYEAVLKFQSPDDEALGRFAAWYKSKQNYDQARLTYRRYSDKVEGAGQIAYSYREQQNFDAAVQAYLQIISHDAEHAAKWKAELAQVYRAMSKWSEAIAVYEQLVTEDSEQASKWRWEVACTHRDAGQFQEAIGHFRQCENFPENYKQMAWCHRRIEQPKEAIILYNQVTSDQNSAPWAMLQIAYTREEAGEQEAAIAAFQTVCKKFPKDGHASQAHAHLQQKYKISITLGGANEQ